LRKEQKRMLLKKRDKQYEFIFKNVTELKLIDQCEIIIHRLLYLFIYFNSFTKHYTRL